MLVLGGGVIGAAAALALARAGHEVTVLEAGGAIGHGSTASSAGIVRVHATDPQSSRLAAASITVWESWADFLDAPPVGGIATFRRCGSVLLDNEADFTTRAREAMRAADVEHEVWSTDELRDHLPFIDPRRFGPPASPDEDDFWRDPVEELQGALHTPSSGYVADPTLAAQNLMDAARHHGATVRLGTTVERLCIRHGRVTGVVLRDGSRVDSDTVLVAVGPHTARLLRAAGQMEDVTVGTRLLREELHHVPAPVRIPVESAGVHLVDGDLGINLRPEAGNAFLVGGDGAAVDGETVVADPDIFDRSVTVALWERNTLRLARRIPDLGVPRRPAGVVGLYDVTDDWLPIYDRAAADGLFIAMGTSGNQFKTAPLVGELLRQIIELESGGMDHTTQALRVPGTPTTISSAPYRRQRTPAIGGQRG